MTTSRRTFLGAAAALAGTAPFPTLAQANWPTKPVRFVVPFAPGGSSEIVARSAAGELTKSLGQSVFVDNKPGASGNIAMHAYTRLDELTDAITDEHAAKAEALLRGLTATKPLTTVRLQELCELGEKMMEAQIRREEAYAAACAWIQRDRLDIILPEATAPRPAPQIGQSPGLQ